MELESQASQLVDKLEQLRSETESYHTASGHWEADFGRIQIVLDAMRAVSQGLAETIAGLKDIRTAEILAAQHSITSAVEGIGNSLETSSPELRSTLKATTSYLRDVLSELATQIKDAANSTVGELDLRLSNVEWQIEKLDELTRRPLWLRLLMFK